jgi:hypothetical protein
MGGEDGYYVADFGESKVWSVSPGLPVADWKRRAYMREVNNRLRVKQTMICSTRSP